MMETWLNVIKTICHRLPMYLVFKGMKTLGFHWGLELYKQSII